MERPEINWEHTESFTAGTVGPQGRRVFFLQASFGNQVLSLKGFLSLFVWLDQTYFKSLKLKIKKEKQKCLGVEPYT